MKVRTRIITLYIVLSASILIIFSIFILALVVKFSYDSADKELSYLSKEVESIFELNSVKTFTMLNENDDLSLVDDKWVIILSSNNQVLYISTYAKKYQVAMDFNNLNKYYLIKNSINRTNDNASKIPERIVYLRTHIEPVKIKDEIFYYIITAVNISDFLKQIQTYSIAEIIGIILFLIFIGIIGYFFGERILKPINRITRLTNRINSQNLHERLPIQNAHDELGQLTMEINSLLSRIEKSFETQKQFISDVAHELKTPLSIIRIKIENQINSQISDDNLKEELYQILESSAYLQTLINKLLLLARLDESKYFIKEPIYLQECIDKIYEALVPLAESKGLTFNRDGDLSGVMFLSDKELIHIALFNIVENAIKYTKSGTIFIHSRVHLNSIIIEIVDTGIGISN